MNKENDPINHPNHYNSGKIETVAFIEDQDFKFHLGNVIKYVCRARFSGNYLKDLKKALWYLEREIKNEEKRQLCSQNKQSNEIKFQERKNTKKKA